jgi:hypothetical protein
MATSEPWIGQIEAIPREPRPEGVGPDVGGAFVHFVCMTTDRQAFRTMAAQYMRDEGWRLVDVEHVEPVRDRMARGPSAPEVMEAMDEVRRTGQPCAAEVWHLFPAEDEES